MTTRNPSVGRCGITAVAVVAFLISAPPALADAVTVEAIRVPDRGVHPQAQTDGKGRVHLIYFKGEAMHGDVFYVRSHDGLKTFSEPVRVNSQPGSVVITGTVRGPHLAVGKGERVHVAWMGSGDARPKALGKHTPMLYARMNDAGDGFEPQRNVISKRPGLDGGGSVAADREGNVYVAWHAPAHGHDEADRQVWVAHSRDDGRTFAAETAAIPKRTGACGCCGMRIVAAGGGRVYIAFRSAAEMVHRDIHLLASDDYGKTFDIAVADPWEVGTCVMSTAAFAESGGKLWAAWETKEQIRLAVLDAKAGKAQEPLSMPGAAGGRKHPAVAVNATGEYVVAWAEGTGWNKGGLVAWQAFGPDGRPVAGASGRAEGVPVWGVPAVVPLRDGGFKVIY